MSAHGLAGDVVDTVEDVRCRLSALPADDATIGVGENARSPGGQSVVCVEGAAPQVSRAWRLIVFASVITRFQRLVTRSRAWASSSSSDDERA